MFILIIHSTFTWHKSNQKKKRITQYNHTLSSHCEHLSFITYFSAQWMIIIEWENAASSMYVTIMSITNAKKTSFIFESRIKSRHHCIKYHQWRAEQRRCVINEQYRHSLRVYLSIMRWIEAIDASLIHSFMIIVSTTWSHHVDDEWFSSSKSFVHLI